jgi:hypothetical protein
MASYKYNSYLSLSDSKEFDNVYQPGVAAPFAGIYKCVVCGHEIGIAQGHILPAQTHAQHDPKTGKIEWKLVVFAMHNSEPKKA